MRGWHHHHDWTDLATGHPLRLVFCFGDPENNEEYDDDEEDGSICDGQIRLENPIRWVPCPYHLAMGSLVADVGGEQMILVAHLEAVPGVLAERDEPVEGET